MAGDCDCKTWEAFNHLMTCSDVERMRKMLARYELFKMSLEVPGDIVECGVFKGAGLLFWVKLLQIYSPASAKVVVGFDTFGALPQLSGTDATRMSNFYQTSGLSECITAPQIEAMVREVTGKKESCLLVAGDVCKTAREYVNQRPGARISLLHLDLDVEQPTVAALEALWPIVSRGGIVIFDEYAIPKWSESRGVDAFFADHPEVTLKTLPWVRTPTAYYIKP